MDHLRLASFSFIRFPGSSPFACELLFYYIYVVLSRIDKRIVKIFQSQDRFFKKTHLSYEPDNPSITLQEYYSQAGTLKTIPTLRATNQGS